jgi:hypothetical protein
VLQVLKVRHKTKKNFSDSSAVLDISTAPCENSEWSGLDNDLRTCTRASFGDANAFKQPAKDEPKPEKEMSGVCRYGSADKVRFVTS